MLLNQTAPADHQAGNRNKTAKGRRLARSRPTIKAKANPGESPPGGGGPEKVGRPHAVWPMPDRFPRPEDDRPRGRRVMSGDTADFAKSIIRQALLLTMAAVISLWIMGNLVWARGLALGSLASAANFALMAWLLPKILNPSRGRAQMLSLGGLSLRFAVMAAALGLALAKPDFMAPLATAVGLFSVQLTIGARRLLAPLSGYIRGGGD